MEGGEGEEGGERGRNTLREVVENEGDGNMEREREREREREQYA